MTASKSYYIVKSWHAWYWIISGMRSRPYRTEVFSLTCSADQEKKSAGFRKSIIKWTKDCSISAVKSLWGNINFSFCDWKISWKVGFTVSCSTRHSMTAISNTPCDSKPYYDWRGKGWKRGLTSDEEPYMGIWRTSSRPYLWRDWRWKDLIPADNHWSPLADQRPALHFRP